MISMLTNDVQHKQPLQQQISDSVMAYLMSGGMITTPAPFVKPADPVSFNGKGQFINDDASLAQIAMIRELVERGAGVCAIAQKLQMSTRRIKAIATKHRVDLVRQKQDLKIRNAKRDELLPLILDLRSKRWTYYMISDHIGVPVGTIGGWVRWHYEQ